MSPTISQTQLQSYSKIFHHLTSHLLPDRRDFFLYALLYFRYGSRLTDENSAFEIPPSKVITAGEITRTCRSVQNSPQAAIT
jgi:hypothetical protein